MPRIAFALCLQLSLLLAAATPAATPVVHDISPRGLTLGQTSTLTVSGANFGETARLLFSGIPVSSQQLKSASGNQAVFEIALGEAAGPGIFAVRLATHEGISAPLAVAVDHLSQQPFAAEIESLPVALTGALSGSTVLKTTFQAAKGQRVVADVESRRLAAKLNPTVRIVNEQGTQLAWSPPKKSIGGDARCELVIPSDGAYTAVLHDALYRGAGPGHFRLKIGDLQHADFALPLGVERGAKAEVQLVGLPDTVKPMIETSADGPAVPHIAARLPTGASLSGGAPTLAVSPFAEQLETPGGDPLQTLAAAPVAVSGRLSVDGEQDRYLVPVAPGAKLRIEMMADAIGSPIDGVLDVLRENGQRLAGNDDQPSSSDPALDFDVPGDADKLIVAVRDMLGRGGDDSVYRVVVRPRDAPDFSLTLEGDAVQIPAGGQALVKVKSVRSGFSGPIKLRVYGLPEGVAVAGGEIPAGSDTALLVLNGSGAPAAGVCFVEGETVGVEPPVRHVATVPATDLTRQLPTLAGEVGYAIAKSAPLQLAWEGSPNLQATLGANVPVQVKIVRGEGISGEVRLALVSNQIIPRKKIKKDNKEEEVDDLDRALRLDGEPTIASDQTTADVTLRVPGDLPIRPWDLVVQGELLSADKKQVLATAYSSLHTLTPVSPLRLELAGEAKVEAKAGKGETGRLKGSVHRAEGFAHAVRISLAGLPDGYVANDIDVAADKSDFELPVRFAYGTKPGALANVKLIAVAQVDSENAVALVRSNEVAVSVNVVPGKKPDAEEPLVIFEDDAKFVEVLTQGNGQISLDESEKKAGKASVKVTPDQRYNPAVPSLGVKIREKPSAPDEYRYLRFAWKKQGGATICLQINHDGAWGPGGSGREGAKFRYHAGTGGECYGASLVLDAKLPTEWTVVTRDLFADFGEFTFTGIALSPVDGEASWFDAIYLGRTPADFELATQ